MSKKIDRRKFIKGAAITGGGLALGGGLLYGRRVLADLLAGGQADIDQAIRDHKQGLISDEEAQATVEAYMTSGGGPGDSRVVHVHDSDATSWGFGNNYYGDFVDQNVVNAMVNRGVMELTDTPSVAEAWRAIIPSYSPGVTKIAIKVNFNNMFYCGACTEGCSEGELKIDALVHPVNALIDGVESAYPSLNYSDIWVYDATVGKNGPDSSSNRGIPENTFQDRCPSGVQFFDGKDQYSCDNYAGYASGDPSADITWRNPGGVPTPPSQQVTDVLVDATYLINMPIMKKHGGAEVTLSFKNHAGSLSNFEPFHDYVYYSGSYYSSSYNPLVDIYRNPNIQGKTVLTIADGLFGNWYNNHSKSEPWITFNNQAANSLLFTADPVAIDCVMCDLLDAESVAQGRGRLRDMADDYLVLAAGAGLGIYERGEPWGSGYSEIDYRYIDGV